MIRIRGKIGNYPIELEIELSSQEWLQLMAGGIKCSAEESLADGEDSSSEQDRRVAVQTSSIWEAARALIQQAGVISGPQLLVELEALSGSVQTAKQLLMRLRHTPDVVLERPPDALMYRWAASE